MDVEFSALLASALSLAFVHTLFGPDHYLPFIMMGLSRKWSLLKTSMITIICGIGHVASSIVLGFIGIALGTIVNKLEFIESVRGEIAAWSLIGFGFVYAVWGIHRAIKNKPHRHLHTHGDEIHTHEHTHHEEHAHVHDEKTKKSITPWALFVIFVLGPCEPLIPLLMYPAAKGHMGHVAVVSLVFGIVTIATMLSVVLITITLGTNLVPLKKIERYTHALAGGTICCCGLAIQFLGL